MTEATIYISAAREDKAAASTIAAWLWEQCGVDAYDWWTGITDSDLRLDSYRAAEIARAEYSAIESSSVFIQLAPRERFGRGCHVELGIALALRGARGWPFVVIVPSDPMAPDTPALSLFSMLADRVCRGPSDLARVVRDAIETSQGGTNNG